MNIGRHRFENHSCRYQGLQPKKGLVGDCVEVRWNPSPRGSWCLILVLLAEGYWTPLFFSCCWSLFGCCNWFKFWWVFSCFNRIVHYLENSCVENAVHQFCQYNSFQLMQFPGHLVREAAAALLQKCSRFCTRVRVCGLSGANCDEMWSRSNRS